MASCNYFDTQTFAIAQVKGDYMVATGAGKFNLKNY